MTSETELALIRRVAQGDETALAILYDRYAALVYSAARRILGDDGAAEETLQDIFHQLWRTASDFDSARGSLAGWLLVTARNRAIDRLRRFKRAAPEPLPENLAAFSHNLESSAAQNEMMSKVRTTLDSLPEAQRQALHLAYFEGLTQSEIAQRTGEPLGTIKSRLRTALGSLKRALNP